MMENFMSEHQPTTPVEPSLGRDMLWAARYYLGTRWTLPTLGSLGIIASLYFGGWGWLVAAGLAPVVLSTLPCLVMCAFGVCMMCRSGEKHSAVSRDTADPALSSASPSTTEISQPMAGGMSCCSGAAIGPSPRAKETQPVNERKDSHA
jgi:hypothetical protein